MGINLRHRNAVLTEHSGETDERTSIVAVVGQHADHGTAIRKRESEISSVATPACKSLHCNRFCTERRRAQPAEAVNITCHHRIKISKIVVNKHTHKHMTARADVDMSERNI